MKPLASALVQCGWSTLVIDIRTAVESPSAFLAHAVEQVPWRDAILIGHSGAGAFLPAIATQCDAAASVFVDAILPPTDAAFVPSATFIEFLDALPTVDAQLPRWDKWWPEGTMNELLPDDQTRSVVTSEFPRLKRSFYDEQVPLTPKWTTRPCCYVRLSPAYMEECERASTWGWPIRQLDGRHLDLVNSAQTVAECR